MASKPAKASLDATYGPGPNPEALYRNSASFVKFARTYQWTVGYDVTTVVDEPNLKTRLGCATHPTCPFSISALYVHSFADGPVKGHAGYKISHLETDPDPFIKNHNHEPPFEPLDLAIENQRRSTLTPNDPTIHNPPLVPVISPSSNGFAVDSDGEGSRPQKRERSSNSRRSMSATSNVGADRDYDINSNRSTSGTKRARTSYPDSTGSSTTSSLRQEAFSPGMATPVPPPSYTSISPVAQNYQAPPPPPSVPALSSQHAQYANQPLASFLLEIDPSFESYLHLFSSNGWPLDTNPQDLLDIDTLEEGNDEIYGLLREVRGLPPCLVAIATDGIRKAKRRQVDSGSTAVIQPKIVMGLEKVLVDRQREAPSSNSAPPPSYTRFIPSSAVRKDLRPAVILVASFSCIYGIIAGAAVLRRRGNYDGYLPSSLSTIYVVLAILYFICSAIEAFGVVAAWKASIKLVRTYFYGTASVALIVTAAEILRLVVHYTQKSAILKACQDSYADEVTRGTATNAEVVSYCQDSWRNATYLDIALLVFSLLISFFFASLAASYLHQLKNPQLLRTQVANIAPSAAYAPPYGVPLQPYPSNLPPYGQSPYAPPNYPPNQQQQGGAGGEGVPSYDNPYGYKPSGDQKDGDSERGQSGGGQQHENNPFQDQVEHQPTTLLIRRPGETVDEFELRQHEHDQAEERRRRGDHGFGESTETVTLEGGGARV